MINLKKPIRIFKRLYRGELWLNLGYEKYISHILLLAALMTLTIALYLITETQLSIIESNKQKLENLRINHSQLNRNLVSFDRPSNIDKKLDEMGSEIGIATKPAIIIEK